VLTLVGGKPVYAIAEFKHLDPPPLPVSPDWSPVKHYGGYGRKRVQGASLALAHRSHPRTSWHGAHTASRAPELWGPLGCDCFAF